MHDIIPRNTGASQDVRYDLALAARDRMLHELGGFP